MRAALVILPFAGTAAAKPAKKPTNAEAVAAAQKRRRASNAARRSR
ncbi:MAG TPA: hypothetical protein VGM88_04565 [Kofleriaceae bacterium]|jgi:hypothetical protein